MSPFPEAVFAKRARAVRQARGMSQRELGDRVRAQGLSVHHSGVNLIEKGRRKLGLNEAVAIARVLRVPLEHLYDDRTWEERVRDYDVQKAERSQPEIEAEREALEQEEPPRSQPEGESR
jgi:transcriptional regulator with XRE-family HTH domain